MNKSKIAISIFNKYAKEYQTKFMDVGLYADSFDFFCENFHKQNASILELACGPGNITKYILNKRPNFKVLGTDLSPNMIDLAKNNNPSADFELMDARKISSLNKTFDGIVCGFCLPYLSMNETGKLLADGSKILNSNGLLYLSTMEDDYSQSGFRKGSTGDEIYMHYYRADDLIEILKTNAFKVLKLDRKVSEMTDGTKVVDLIIIAQKIKL